jgi:hypothetical protein
MAARSSHVTLPTAVGRAVSALGLGRHATMLLWHVLEWSYGGPGDRPDRIPCPIDTTALATSWGIHRNRVTESRRRLVRSAIVAEVAGGLLFVPHPSAWVNEDGNTPLLSPDLLAYVEAVASQPNPVASQLNPVASQLNPVASQLNPVASQLNPVASPTTEHAGARAELVFSSEEEKDKTRQRLVYTSAEQFAHARPDPPPAAVDRVPDPETRHAPVDRPSGGESDSQVTPAPAAASYDPALIAAGKELRRVCGDAAAAKLKRNHAAIEVAIAGRWDFFRQAVLNLEAKQARPGAETIRDALLYLQGAVKGMIAEGAPVPVPPRPARPATTPIPPYYQPSAERIAEVERCKEATNAWFQKEYESRQRRRPARPDDGAAAPAGGPVTIGSVLASMRTAHNGE